MSLLTTLFCSMKGYSSLRDYAKEIFAEDVTEEEFNAVYTRDGVFLEDLPFSAQTQIWRARSLFYKDDKTFKVEIDLAKTHGIESVDDLTKEDMNIIKPVFANAYLQQVGIVPTEKAIKQVNKMIDINKHNVQVHTRKKGYEKDQIIIKEKATEYFNTLNTKIDTSDKRCDEIRSNIRAAWSELEEFFPRELPIYQSKPFVHKPTFVSLQFIEDSVKPVSRCPTSRPVQFKVNPKVKNPFNRKWALNLTKEEDETIIHLFLDKFDFKKNFKLSNQQISNLKNNVMTMGFVPRLFYYVAKYFHNIFVLDQEDLSNYIRIRAIWFILGKKYREEDYYLSPIIVMLKICTIILYLRNAPKNSIENTPDMEATILTFIDKLMNPYNVYDTMPTMPRTMHQPRAKKIPPGRSLNDIIKLVDMMVLNDIDIAIARSMLNQNAVFELTQFFNNEPWGDLLEDIPEENDEPDDTLALPIQKIIQQDVAELNWTVPHRVSDWMKDENAKTLSNPNQPMMIASPYSITSSYYNQSTGTPSGLNLFKTPSSTYLRKSGPNQRSRNSSKLSLFASPISK